MSSNNLFENLNFNPENIKTLKDKTAQMQNQMLEAQKMLAAIEIEGSAGIENYNVKVLMNGRHEAVRVAIAPQLMTQSIEVLCDLIASAITDASHKTEAAIQNKMIGLFKNLNLPNQNG
jgi:DNA-binding YbaB/EbfC family protein